MKKKVYIIVGVIAAILLFLAGAWIGRETAPKINTTPKAEIKTDKSVNPTPSYSRPTGAVTVPVSIETKAPDDPTLPKSEILLFPPKPKTADSGTCSDDIGTKDSFRVQIPLTQKEYRDSNYTAYVSGFNAKLDSIEINTKVVTYTKSVTKFRTWNIGLTGGYGYGFRSKQFEPFIGIGITLNLFR